MKLSIESPVSRETARRRGVPEGFCYVHIDMSEVENKRHQVAGDVFSLLLDEDGSDGSITAWFTNASGVLKGGVDKNSECAGENVKIFNSSSEFLAAIQPASFESVACFVSNPLRAVSIIKDQVRKERKVFRFLRRSRMDYFVSADFLAESVGLVFVDQDCESLEIMFPNIDVTRLVDTILAEVRV